MQAVNNILSYYPAFCSDLSKEKIRPASVCSSGRISFSDNALQNNANKTAGALVDDPLEGLLKLGAGVLGHPLEFGIEILADQLVEGAAENIGLPDGLGVPLKLLEEEVDHFLALLFIAHNGGYLCLNVRPDHVYCLVQTEVLPLIRWIEYSCASGIALR